MTGVQTCALPICQRNATDLRLDVVFQKALRGFEGGRSEFHLGVVLHPHLQPATYRVGLGPSVVDADVFLDCLFQLFFYFRLRLAEDVFDDGLASFRIVADCVPALPTTILAFSDVPFPVCSSFWHGISPFRNEQYRNQGNKATEKRNRYQKVIICTSEPRRLIFAYCGAIFALPEAFFFGHSGAIFERSRSPFIDYSGAKYTRFPPKIAAAQKALFRVVENGKFLKRLRNVHLEKSVATGICRVQRSPKTAKTPRKV